MPKDNKTRLLFLNKKGTTGKKVLLTMNDPGAYIGLKPLITGALNDQRCSLIAIILSGIAQESFVKDFLDNQHFMEFSNGQKPFLVDITEFTVKYPLDVVIATVSAINGPESVALYGGKSVLRAKKLFYLFEGWSDMGNAFSGNKSRMDEIDGIFCNNDLAKAIILQKIKGFPEDKIYTTGTGQTETLELEMAHKYSEETRTKLGISSNATVILYMSSISSELKHFYGVDGRIEEQTFIRALETFSELADIKPDDNFVILFRPHPRDPGKEDFFAIAGKQKFPSNLKFMDGSTFNINQVSYAADILVSTCSTEIFKAPLRSKAGLFLGFTGKGMGYDLLSTLYDRDILTAIGQAGVTIIKSSGELKEYMLNFRKASLQKTSSFVPKNSTSEILDIVLV